MAQKKPAVSVAAFRAARPTRPASGAEQEAPEPPQVPEAPADVDTNCVVPETVIRTTTTQGGQTAVRAWVDAEDKMHVLSVNAAGGGNRWRLYEHVQQANGTWQHRAPAFELPADRRLGENFDVTTSPSGAVHVCLPLRSRESAEGRELLYLTRNLETGAWHSEEIDNGVLQCDIHYDAAPERPPYTFGRKRLMIGYAKKRPDTLSSVPGGWPDHWVPHIAKRRTLPTHAVLAGSRGVANPHAPRRWQIDEIRGCVDNWDAPPRLQVDCGKNIRITTEHGGAVHAAYTAEGAFGTTPWMLWTAREFLGGRQSTWIAGPAQGSGLEHPFYGRFQRGTSPAVAMVDEEFYVFDRLTHGYGRNRIYALRIPTSQHIPSATVFEATPISNSQVAGSQNVGNLSPSSIERFDAVPLDVVFNAAGEWRVLYAHTDRDGRQAELRLAYDGYDESVISSNLINRGDYAVAISSEGFVRAAYWNGHNNHLSYYQEENEIELLRSPNLPSYDRCEKSHFDRFCEPLHNKHLRLQPQPFGLSDADLNAYDITTILGIDEGVLDLYMPLYNGPPSLTGGLAGIKTFELLWRGGQEPIDSANGGAPVSETVHSYDGSISLLEDVARDITLREGRVPLRRQAAVCVPKLSSGAESQMLHHTDTQRWDAACSTGWSFAYDDDDFDLDAYEVRGPNLTERSAVDAHAPVLDDISGDLAGAIDCAGDANAWVVENGPGDLDCARCPAGSVYAPAWGVCVRCGPEATVRVESASGQERRHLAPGAVFQPGDHVMCLACPEPAVGEDAWVLDSDAHSCQRCPEGTAAKRCSTNEQCLDTSTGHRDRDYACGESGYCEEIVRCSDDLECGSDYICRQDQCVKASTWQGTCFQSPWLQEESCVNQFSKEDFKTLPQERMCDPVGCLKCWENAYCSSDNDCPTGHECTGQSEVLTPACMLRPLLDDPKIIDVKDMIDLESLVARFQGILRKFALPERVSSIQKNLQITSVRGKLEGVYLQIADYPELLQSRPEARRKQGVIEVGVILDRSALKLKATYELPSVLPKIPLEITADSDLVLRAFFMPTMNSRAQNGSRVGKVQFTLIGVQLTRGRESGESVAFDINPTGISGNIAEVINSVFGIEDIGALEDRVVEELDEALAGLVSDDLGVVLETLYEALTQDKLAGFMLFNYQPACLDENRVGSVEQVVVSNNSLQTIFRLDPNGTPACRLPEATVNLCAPAMVD